METFLISYVPSNDIHNSELTNRITSLPIWVRISETTYIIATEMTPQQIYNLIVILPNQDQLYVITAARPYAGQGSRKADEWLHSNLSTPKRIPAQPPDLIR